jgi:hypothetical protein
MEQKASMAGVTPEDRSKDLSVQAQVQSHVQLTQTMEHIGSLGALTTLGQV